MDIGGEENRLLTDDEKQEFRDFEEMFRTPGWNKLQKEIEEEITGAPSRLFWDVKSWDELLHERNRLGNLMRLAQYEMVLEQRKEGIIRNRLQFLEEATAEYSTGE